jgi:ketosteroid isomerase-like protein
MILINGCQQQHDMQKLQNQVDSINEQLATAMMVNDYDSYLKFYTEDAISLPSYGPMLKGMDALKEDVEKQREMDMKITSFSIKSTDLWASGKFVIDIGTYEMGMEMPEAPGEVWNDKGKYLTVFEIQEDGSLLMKADTWNTDLNPWEEMMNAQENGK